MTTQRLVTMANQVADFFVSYPEPEAIENTFGHLKSFWDPRMRREIEAHLANAGGAGLKPIALAAVKRLAEMDAAKKKSA
ncbi:MAG TPA: formate dehydrogenase subunit delta [Dongiaceae bacterium]|nr:formate dehydrogenase subunit delta [Dongiaceae bacterium]